MLFLLFRWRVAFIACGAPGVLAAVMVLRLRDPISDTAVRGNSLLLSRYSSRKVSIIFLCNTRIFDELCACYVYYVHT